MPSKIEIINQALILLGEDLVADLSAGAGEVADTLYKTVNHNLLSSYRWRFATKKVALSEYAGSPVNEWDRHFSLPTDFILLNRVYPEARFEIFEDKILTDSTTISIEYVFDPGEKTYPVYYTRALSHVLAADMAMSIANDKKLAEMMDSKATRSLGFAKNRDSQGRRTPFIQHRPYVAVRG